MKVALYNNRKSAQCINLYFYMKILNQSFVHRGATVTDFGQETQVVLHVERLGFWGLFSWRSVCGWDFNPITLP